MAVTFGTRKPIHQLTLADLEAFPIWEYCLDEEDVPGQDETWVRPLRNRRIPREKYSLTVASDFEVGHGKSYKGFVGVTTAERKVEICQGVILDGRKPYLFIPNPELREFQKLRADLYDGLGIPELIETSLEYTLRVPVEGEQECRSGQIL